MNQSAFSTPQPYVIVISGSVGSGKSTISAGLAKALGDVPLLTFDHYGPFVEWPQNMAEWIKDGAKPSQIRVPRLKEDLISLIHNKAITDPFNNMLITPADYIVLEEPSGRERIEIREFIDLVVYLDVPPDICVIRMIERLLDLKEWME